MAYKLLIISTIPVYIIDGVFCSLDLWVRDLQKQIDMVDRLILLCPVVDGSPARKSKEEPLPPTIEVFADTNLKSTHDYENLGTQVDVIQIAANKPAWDSTIECKFLKIAYKLDICFIAGLSSNRANTTLMNAKGKGVVKVIKSWIIYLGIKFSINYFTKRADGVFIIGNGLLKLVNPAQSNVFVNTASWIRQEDLVSDEYAIDKALDIQSRQKLKLCVATRLEYMKGVHIAIDALKILQDQLGDDAPELLILGEGEEHEKLRNQTLDLGLDDKVEFGGLRTYPNSFFATIRDYDLILLTNLNDEQPRLVFDAISQGLIPICPDTPPFQGLNLERHVYYERGSAYSLAQTIINIGQLKDLRSLLFGLLATARKSTVDTMHFERAKWISETVSRKMK